MLRETAAAARRDITRARCAGVDPAFCVAARQALEDCMRMYRHKLKGLSVLEVGMRRERRAYYMAQFVSRVDAISAVARAYVAQIQDGRARA